MADYPLTVFGRPARIAWRIPGYMPMLDYRQARPRWFFWVLTNFERRLGRKLW